ncbi:MAG: lipoprotein LipL21 [Leptospiraceae bacterium]|nr:lipoprotein LipL21 [Leptospiraceae bacterium]
MIRKSILFLIAFAITLNFTACSSSEDVTELKGGQQFEGWAGPPEDVKAKPAEYFYMKTAGRASEKALNKRSGAMMQTTCTDAATVNAKGDLIGKLIGESITGASGISDGESTGKVVVREFSGKLQGVNVKECKPIAVPDPSIPLSEYKECQCVIFVKVPGGRDAIVARAKEIEAGN